MPVHRFPQQEENWKINYGPEGLGDIVRAFQVSFTQEPGKITTTRRLQPHHTNSASIAAGDVPSSYVFTNADTVLRYWSYWTTLFKTNNSSPTSLFQADALGDSPTSPDGDLAVFGRTADGQYDILYATAHRLGHGNIAVLNQDFGPTWIRDYWSGPGGDEPIATSSSAGASGEIRITLTSGSTIQNGDTVVIRNHSEPSANGTWVVHNAGGSPTVFDLVGSIFVASGTGGQANEIYDVSDDQTYLGQPQLDDDFPIILKRFSSAQQDLLFVANGSRVHTIGPLHTAEYQEAPFIIGTSTNTTPITVATAVANGFSTGDTVIIAGHQGNTAANGRWQITVTAPAAFQLNGSSGNGAPVALTGTATRVHTNRTSDVVYNRLVFFADYECNWIQCSKDRVYLGFKNRNDVNQPSYVVEYDPLTETDNPVINYNGATTGFIYENICYIVDVKGWISKFNANGFSKVAAFPFAYIDGLRITAPHRNGIALLDDKPHILVPGRRQTFSQILPAGVWCWEPDTERLYHKNAPSFSGNQQVSYGTSTIGGTADGRYGALFPLPSTSTKSQDFFAGLAINTSTTSATGILGTFSTVVSTDSDSFDNRGWIVTSKIYSRDINAIFRNTVTQYYTNQYPLGLQSGAILVKYRTSDPVQDVSTFATGAWTSTTSFTVPAASVPNIAVGNEVFITSGRGAGLSAHITSITGGATLTITIDEIMLGASGSMEFVYENWTKLTDEVYTDGRINDNTVNNHQFDIPENEESFIQFKLEIRAHGTSPYRGLSLEEFAVGYQENLRAEGYQRDQG